MAAKYGQHFLINKHACERIVNTMRLGPNDTVFEIGPGKGALTTLIAQKAGRVIAVGIDPELAAALKRRIPSAKLTVINQSILQVNADEHADSYKIVGNLPYNLTSPILRKISLWTNWTEAYVMVQKEVGDRMSASVGTPEYGALTVGMSLSCQISPVFDLSENSFKPAPRVRSSVVKLTRRERPLTSDIDKTQRVIQAAFQQRRKTIINSLSHGLGAPKEKVEAVLQELGLNKELRAERISVDEFVSLAHRL